MKKLLMVFIFILFGCVGCEPSSSNIRFTLNGQPIPPCALSAGQDVTLSASGLVPEGSEVVWEVKEEGQTIETLPDTNTTMHFKVPNKKGAINIRPTLKGNGEKIPDFTCEVIQPAASTMKTVSVPGATPSAVIEMVRSTETVESTRQVGKKPSGEKTDTKNTDQNGKTGNKGVTPNSPPANAPSTHAPSTSVSSTSIPPSNVLPTSVPPNSAPTAGSNVPCKTNQGNDKGLANGSDNCNDKDDKK